MDDSLCHQQMACRTNLPATETESKCFLWLALISDQALSPFQQGEGGGGGGAQAVSSLAIC